MRSKVSQEFTVNLARVPNGASVPWMYSSILGTGR